MSCKSLVISILVGVFTFYSLGCNYVIAQNWEENITIWFNQQVGKSPDYQKISTFSLDELKLLQVVINKHAKDSIFDVKWLGLSLTSQIGLSSSDESIIKASLSNLLLFIYDPDTRIQYSASESVTSYPSKYFTNNHRDTLILLLNSTQNRSITTNLIKLAGKLELRGALPYLNEISGNPKNPFIQRWVSLAALTRMGDTEAEKKMFDFMVKSGYTLDAITMLYPYILFSRSRNNVNHLISAINNDDSECESSNPNVTTRIPCAYHILKVVGPEIVEINWAGPNGLEMLKPTDAIEKARVILKSIENNWSFTGE